MGIRINENVFSLFVNRNLVRANAQLERAFRKLSSGQKITKSADDPAGLANSHQLRTKIDGLQRNVINSNQGINMMTVAESALGNLTDMVQRIRELAIQASSDTITQDQRLLIQGEIDNLIEEMDRIAQTANYNNRNLLDGTFQNLRLQVGTRINEGIPISIESARTAVVGAVSVVTGALQVDDRPIPGLGELTINAVAVPTSQFDGISISDGAASAIAKAEAINSIEGRTGVRATADPTVYEDAGAQILGGAIDGITSSLTINGVNIGAVGFDGSDATGSLQQAINTYSEITGVVASMGAGGQLVLTAEDSRNMEIQTTGGAAQRLGLSSAVGDINLRQRSTVTLTSANTIQITGDLALLGLTGAQATTFVDPTTAIANLSVLSFERAQAAIRTTDVALNQLISRRAAIGAVQSRLDQTLEDLLLNIENLSAADSRIRDADFAVVSSQLTQAQIIQEAGVAILAQANVIPRMALSLLER